MTREGMSPAHLRKVAQLPCLLTGLEDGTVSPHHLLRTGEHGTGRRSADMHAVPLSHKAHDRLHHEGDEDAFFARYGYDARQVAADLWVARGDLDAMRRVIHRARASAALAAIGLTP